MSNTGPPVSQECPVLYKHLRKASLIVGTHAPKAYKPGIELSSMNDEAPGPRLRRLYCPVGEDNCIHLAAYADANPIVYRYGSGCLPRYQCEAIDRGSACPFIESLNLLSSLSEKFGSDERSG